MLESVSANDKLIFADLSEEEKKKRGILGRLYGPCADIIKSTRNGRRYSDKLWEKVFQQPLVTELFANGGIPGELDHPADRSETCSEKIAIMMPEPPKKDGKGRLVGYWDIIDTPNGRIAYSLAKYGFKLGISSRGDGDVKEDFMTGEQTVDPNTYTFQAFDLVLIPSVEQARLSLITEGLDTKTSDFRKSLKESLEKASPKEREIMESTLKGLRIDMDALLEKKDNKQENIAADDVGADVIKNLQEALKKNRDFQLQIRALQEKLSVCYAKEAKLTESLQKAREDLVAAEEDVQRSNSEIQELNEQLAQQSQLLEGQSVEVKQLREKLASQTKQQKSLNESMQENAGEVKRLSEQLITERKKASEQLKSLQEDLAEAQQNSLIKEKEYDRKITKSNGLVEHYKKVANTAVTKYIETKARLAGVSVAAVKQRLGENYSFNDIDRVCESLGKSPVRMGSLPFDPSKNKEVKVSIRESQESLKPRSGYDDEIDPQLIYLARK